MPLIVSFLLYSLVLGVAGVLAGVLPAVLGEKKTIPYSDAYGDTTGSLTTISFGAASYAALAVGYLLLFIVGVFMAVGFTAGSLDIADGKQVTIGSFFKWRNLGPAFLTVLLVGVAASIGSLCVVGGLIVAFVAQFAVAICH